MRKFFVLVRKEIRELLTPQTIIPLFFTVLLFLFMGQVIGAEGEKMSARQSISVLDLDVTPASEAIPTVLEQANLKVELYHDASVDAVIETTKKARGTVVLVLPEGFEKDLAASKLPQIEAYNILSGFSFARLQAGVTGVALASINESLSNKVLSSVAPGTDPQILKNPIKVKEHVIVGDKMAVTSLAEVTGFVMAQTTFIPIILFIVIILAATMIATAIATEKENKTLETLLSAPVRRTTLVLAKMFAAGMFALVAAVVYLFSFRYYMESVTGGALTGAGGAAMSQAIRELGLVLNPAGYTLLGVSLFFSILCALVIAVTLGAFAEDVKSVQALITPLMIMILIPYVLAMFLDINTVSPVLRYVVLAIPFSHSFLAAPNLFFGDYRAVLYGIAYEIAFFAVFLYIAGRLFSSDKILTMKLRIKKRPVLK
ncbi:MAG: ABC transporter permease [Candidatus Aquicultor sp.]|nr:ABC transporter permease [Candidatus Aquicultor sp.]